MGFIAVVKFHYNSVVFRTFSFELSPLVMTVNFGIKHHGKANKIRLSSNVSGDLQDKRVAKANVLWTISYGVKENFKVESGFRNGTIKLLIATTTLSSGPGYSVIIFLHPSYYFVSFDAIFDRFLRF